MEFDDVFKVREKKNYPYCVLYGPIKGKNFRCSQRASSSEIYSFYEKNCDILNSP